MNQVHANLPSKKFTKPKEVNQVTVCTKSGDLPGPYCSRESAYFVPGTQPKSKCSVHVRVTVCKNSGKLPSAYCKTTTKTCTKRKEPFVSKYNSGRYPSDWSLEVPTKTCNGKHATKATPKPTKPPKTIAPTVAPTATPIPVASEEPTTEPIDQPTEIAELE